MVIAVLDHVPHCYTADDGLVVAGVIRREFSMNRGVTLSFRGAHTIPSSFANAAFVTLLDTFDIDYIKRHLRIVDSTAQINSMIRDRLNSSGIKQKASAYV